MCYVLVSPILPGNIANFQLRLLQNRFSQAKLDLMVKPVTEKWTTTPDWKQLHSQTMDADYENPFYRLFAIQPALCRRLIFDIRRQQGQFPYRVCRFLQYAASATSHVSALVSAEDEDLVTMMFPFKETIPALFVSSELFLQRQLEHTRLDVCNP